MATVHQLRPATVPQLSKKQLAAAVGRSERWLELRRREGLPDLGLDRRNRRRYDLAAVEAWIADRERAPRTAPVDRVGRLEADVAELRGLVVELMGRTG